LAGVLSRDAVGLEVEVHISREKAKPPAASIARARLVHIRFILQFLQKNEIKKYIFPHFVRQRSGTGLKIGHHPADTVNTIFYGGNFP
jgi:hypothetical protein